MGNRGDRKRDLLDADVLHQEIFSSVLAHCAFRELAESQEGRRNGWRSRDNHYSFHAVGSVVLLVAAFEAWLNEAAHALMPSDRGGLVKLLEKSLLCKFVELSRFGGQPLPGPPDGLRLVVIARNEMVHHYPDPGVGGSGLPRRLDRLRRSGLLIEYTTEVVGLPGVDFHFSQKLCSHKLAYWCWCEVRASVHQLLRALGRRGGLCAFTAESFELYRHLLPPERLGEFDAQHGLGLSSGAEAG